MSYADLSPLANHVWQSILCAAAAWVLTLALKENRAAVRYWLWLAASVKFLIPFSLLVIIGGQLGWRSAPAIPQPRLSIVMNEISRPFTVPAEASPLMATPPPSEFPIVLLGLWLCGFTLELIFWLRSIWQIRAVARGARPLLLNLPIPVVSSPARLEPGVFGIRKPVLILPEGITALLTHAQLEAVLAHELCHVRRRDNLTAAIHMVVEVVFWFHPLVWWIRRQLVAERERACDEEVVKAAADPQVYAEGILNVCKFYLESPVACVSGVTGANLKERIAEIMTRRAARNLTCGKRVLLVAAGLAAAAGPITIGVLYGPAGRAQAQAGTLSKPTFEVASIKPSNADPSSSGIHTGHGRLDANNVSLKRCIMGAYGVGPHQIFGGPDWLDSDRFEIAAKADQPTDSDAVLMVMLQSLLAERFKLVLHRETRTVPAFVLEIAKNGPKLDKAEAGEAGTNTSTSNTGSVIDAHNTSMDLFAKVLARKTELPVVNHTGLEGVFNFKLQWAPDSAATAKPADGSATEGASLFTVIQEQLGLRLRSQRAPVEVLVIEHVEKPSEN